MDESSEFDKRSIALSMAMNVQRHCYQPNGDRYTNFDASILERAEKFYEFLCTRPETSSFAEVVEAPPTVAVADYKRSRYDNPEASEDEIPF